MHSRQIPLLAASPGSEHRLTVLSFGNPGDGPKAYIQAALHADEIPALLVAQQLRQQLRTLESAGALHGEVVLVPYANPLGLGQQLLGQLQGRFDLRDGLNFNRGCADLAPAVVQAMGASPGLGSDSASNCALIRGALRQAAAAETALHAAQDLKLQLLRLAIDADIVLDLHCDGQAAMHLYALTPQAELATELGGLLGARAVLLATESGDSPFDEACSRPWLQLQQQFPQAAIPLACFAATVELRGEADTSHALAGQDARALIEFLRRRGIVSGASAPMPMALCEATPLAGSEPVVAPHAGIVVFHVETGQVVQVGQAVADVVDIDSGGVTPVTACSAGVLYARVATRWVTAGGRLAKIAGTALARSGKLLSP